MPECKVVRFDPSANEIEAVKALSAGKKYMVITYGCQMNESESQRHSALLERMGYAPTDDKAQADFILFNTCCVREGAEDRVYGNVGALAELKLQKPSLIIAVCGCMMQQEGAAAALQKRFPFVNIVFGSHNSHRLPQLLLEALSGERVNEVWQTERELPEEFPVKRDNPWSAWLTIMYGCNNFCTYCIVPYVRGRERSRSSRDIIAEAERLAADGCREITLLGQNVNSYGKDCGEISFAQLLRRLDGINGIERLDFMTSHPKDCSEELLHAVAECRSTGWRLHLPVQSGSDEILRRMNRRYTHDEYLALVKKAREIIPDVAITTDIIVGFPGETDKDFEETVRLVREAGFAAAYTFIYSKRSGTPAAKSSGQIPLNIKKQRLSQLLEVQAEQTHSFNASMLNKAYPVRAESISRRSHRRLSGLTRNGRTVTFEADKALLGRTVNVRITEVKANTLSGEITEDI